MAGSTISKVKAAMVSALTALPALSNVQVTYADPGDTARKQLLWFGAVIDNEHEPVALRAGRRRREENFTLKAHIEVSGVKQTPQRSEEQALVIVQVLEEYLADNPKIGGAVPGVLFAVVSSVEMITDQTTDGPRTVATVLIAVKARLL